MRNYTPQSCTLDDWLAYADALGITRGILVQPSVYGFDNRVLLDALRMSPERLRGIVVVDPSISPSELKHLDAIGVRGVRINLRNPGGLTFAAVEVFGRRLATLGWCLQMQIGPQQFSDLLSLVPRLEVPVVIDHLGFVDVQNGKVSENHVAALQRLLDGGRTLLKISAPYRLTGIRPSKVSRPW